MVVDALGRDVNSGLLLRNSSTGKLCRGCCVTEYPVSNICQYATQAGKKMHRVLSFSFSSPSISGCIERLGATYPYVYRYEIPAISISGNITLPPNYPNTPCGWKRTICGGSYGYRKEYWSENPYPQYLYQLDEGEYACTVWTNDRNQWNYSRLSAQVAVWDYDSNTDKVQIYTQVYIIATTSGCYALSHELFKKIGWVQLDSSDRLVPDFSWSDDRTYGADNAHYQDGKVDYLEKTTSFQVTGANDTYIEPWCIYEGYYNSDIVTHNGVVYKCKKYGAHSACDYPESEPGVGASWTNYWEVV